MILEEEYDEARIDISAWTLGFLLTLVPASAFGACIIAGWTWAVAPAIASTVAGGFCYRARHACERTIKDYRDQERLERVQMELSRKLANSAPPKKPFELRPKWI